MTEHELREIETLTEDIDTLCDMTLQKANSLAEQYALQKRYRPDKFFTEHILDLIKIRLTMRIEKEIFGHDN